LKLIPAYGVGATFRTLSVIFFVITFIGVLLLKNPPAGYKPARWDPAATSKCAATTHEFSPGETLRTPTFYLMWVAYALGCSAGLMVISQLVPFAKSVGIQFAFVGRETPNGPTIPSPLVIDDQSSQPMSQRSARFCRSDDPYGSNASLDSQRV
jgi:hypothetical protein